MSAATATATAAAAATATATAANRFRVFVDLRRLRENLARTDGRPATDDHARAFLADAGFHRVRAIPTRDAYVADSHALAHLEPDEVRSVQPLHAHVFQE